MQTQSQKSTQSKSTDMTGAMEVCIQNCLDCYKICSQMLIHCLEKGGEHAEAQHIKLLEDCAKICNLSADFMLRSSEFHSSICGECAEICTACAESCEAFADDEKMKNCAAVCRKCASSCDEMAQGKH